MTQESISQSCEIIEVMTSQQVKNFRTQLGMTQAEFAKFVGAPLGTIASWEYGKTMSALANLRVKTLQKTIGPKLIANQQARQQLLEEASYI
jgi:DNA-binding transcriptional regulator YiaG